MEYFIERQSQQRNYRREYLYAEYVEACKASNEQAYSYGSFCSSLAKWRRESELAGLPDWYPGEYMRTYWSNFKIGEQWVSLFVAQLVSSDYTFVTRCSHMSVQDWIRCCIKAFEYFGAVPHITDYPQVIAAKKSLEALESFAHHYKTILYGARPKTAKTSTQRHKPIDAKSSSFVVRSIRKDLRNSNDDDLTLEKMDAIIESGLERYNNATRTNADSRRQAFDETERSQMLNLPKLQRPEIAWAVRRVRSDHHIQVDRALYSAPYQYALGKVRVATGDNFVRAYHLGELIAVHNVIEDKQGRMISTDDAHRPPRHRMFAKRLEERFLNLASEFGPSTKRVMKLVIHDCKRDGNGFLKCKELLTLSRKPAALPLEEACKSALKSNRQTTVEEVTALMSLEGGALPWRATPIAR